MNPRVAIVTGANRGIGFALVKRLCKDFNGDVYLTSRDVEKGMAAVKALKSEGLKPRFHELDITDIKSIESFKDYIQKQYHGVDILINNAGYAVEKESDIPLPEQAEKMVKTNFKGTMNMCKAFLPLLSMHSRLIIIASGFGQKKFLGEKLQRRLDVSTFSLEMLDDMMDEYVQATKFGTHEKVGWPIPNTSTKIFQVALAKILSRDISKENKDILVNACCPGWTVTDAVKSYLDENGYAGNTKAKQPDEAAEDVIWLALLPPGTKEPSGELLQYRKVIPFE